MMASNNTHNILSKQYNVHIYEIHHSGVSLSIIIIWPGIQAIFVRMIVCQF